MKTWLACVAGLYPSRDMGGEEDLSLKSHEQEDRTASLQRSAWFYTAWLLGTEIAIPVIVYLRLSLQGWPRQVAVAWAAASGLILIPPDLILLRLLRRGSRSAQ